MARSHRTLRIAAVGLTAGFLAAAGILNSTLRAAPAAVQAGPADIDAPNSALPPERFQALRGATIVMTLFVPAEAVEPTCLRFGMERTPGYTIAGCTVIVKGEPVIILPSPCERPGAYMTPSYVACHEIGHVNGWQHEAE
jgi:hypothetical protein